MKWKKKVFEDKFSHNKGDRCPLCDLPVVDTPNSKIICACIGCGRSFIRKGLIPIEQYLDPEDLFQFENYTGLSPAFHNILREENDWSQKRKIMGRRGLVLDILEQHRPWVELSSQCLQTRQSEEGIFCMVKALHGYHTNPGFWLNIAQMAGNFYLFPMMERAITIAELLDPTYEALSRVKKRLRLFRQEEENKKSYSSAVEKKIRALERLGFELLRMGKRQRAYLRLKQLLDFDPNHHLALTNVSVLSAQYGELEVCHQVLEKALLLYPSDPIVHYNCVNLHIIKGNIPMAIQKVKDALALDPTNQRFQAKLLQLEQKQK